ncbi:hypothetical protein Tco_0770699 [Tanacetum coccineum]|uniref:Reverse transcriptase domain-containing protein n=1 Tax=Tanacetum coccineum TaxID=301880 RepID=A0ABQ4ZCZ8_9ASTR
MIIVLWLLARSTHRGYEDAIVYSEFTANNFEIKHGLLNHVKTKQFFGNDKEDPRAYIRYFNKITSTMKIPNVPNTSVKVMLFPFSLEGAARIWLEKEPPRSLKNMDDHIPIDPKDQEKKTFTCPITELSAYRPHAFMDPSVQDWKNPHQDKFENKEINEAFPLETLGSIALNYDRPHDLWQISDKTLCTGQEALEQSQSLPPGTYWGHYGANYTAIKDFPDCEDSRACSIHKSFTSSASFWESSIQI